MNNSVFYQVKRCPSPIHNRKWTSFFDESISMSRRADRPKHREFYHRIEEIDDSQNGSAAP